MSKSKAKGTRGENLIVDKLTNAGIKCERVPLSGALGGKYSGDVIIGSIDNPQWQLEIKNRESITATLWEWLYQDVNNDFVIVKKNYHEPLALMSMATLIKLLKAAQLD